ncbi:site-2 protease family protein [Gudongella oleilytica]|jgi:Zn-dependent protease|uniref:site-2 protease family protein n=1 Tax=Gudongella oleilytica TaxID=1582259 RepID=UPI000FF8ACD5|nr:site-2 protease family protein [Gudongella oleilytica]MDY0255757.1 site-2 protease family protein [Gudongella oleilytica]
MSYLISLPGLLTAIIFHELAHGLTAYWLGDPTAKDAGRLTLNPIRHIDPVGFLFMLVFRFGWAKAVPINPMNFKNRKRDTILVSIAGVTVNFIIAMILGAVLVYGNVTNQTAIDILGIGMWYNIMLGVFNLLPFPPLDGSKVVASLLPVKMEYYFYKYERYFYIILLGLIATDMVQRILGPLVNFAYSLIIRILV